MAKKPIKSADKSESVYKITVNKIIESLRKGVVPWDRKWGTEARVLPYSGSTKQPYKGSNLIILMHSEIALGYENSDWLTFKQITDQGGNVKKGETNTSITSFNFTPKVDGKRISREEENNLIQAGRRAEIQYQPGSRVWQLFNRDQAEGLPELTTAEIEARKVRRAEIESSSMVQKIGKLYDLHNAKPIKSGNIDYDKVNDVIKMPPVGSFEDKESYARAYLHQLARWTGHESRLNRDFSETFENEAHAEAFEEMVSTLTSAFICAEMGIDSNLQHPEYISTWIDILDNDENLFFKAARTAQKAADFLMEPVRTLNQAKTTDVEQDENEDLVMGM